MRKLEAGKRLISLGLAGIGLMLESVVFYYYWITNFSPSITTLTGVPYYWRADILEVVFYFFILYFLSNMYGGFRIGFLKSSEVIFSQAFATLAANVLIYFELSIMAKAFFVLKMFLIMTVMQIIIAIV